MKLRYAIGIPYLYFVASMGGNVMFEAIVIGVLAGITDIWIQGGGGPRFGG